MIHDKRLISIKSSIPLEQCPSSGFIEHSLKLTLGNHCHEKKVSTHDTDRLIVITKSFQTDLGSLNMAIPRQ